MIKYDVLVRFSGSYRAYVYAHNRDEAEDKARDKFPDVIGDWVDDIDIGEIRQAE